MKQFEHMTYTELLNYCYRNGITVKAIQKGTKEGIIATIKKRLV